MGLRKAIALAVIFAFLFQMDVFLHTQRGDDIEAQFRKIKESFLKEQHIGAQKRIERLMVFIDERKLGTQKILGMCRLLLGAIYERGGDLKAAEENYRKAKEDYDTRKVDGVDLGSLELYRKIVIEPPPAKNVIAKPGKKKKKKFPWLLVAGGVVIVTVVLILLLKKKKKYKLTVELFEGVQGAPVSGVHSYGKGTVVGYSYTSDSGYENPRVMLDGREVSSSGTVVMDGNHTLSVSADRTARRFITSVENISINEGDNTTFTVRLSAAPDNETIATVTKTGGDMDIEILDGKSLTFTPSNWNEDQVVTIKANFDGNSSNDEATIVIDAPGIPEEIVTVSEVDLYFDDSEPEIRITSPSDEDEVGGSVKIEVEATDEEGINRVEFFIDGVLKHTDELSPYSYTWDTTDYWDMEGDDIEIKARVYDNIGQSDEDSVTVKIKNDKRPTVSITSPSNGETVNGTITIRVDAWDDVGITKVELYVDDAFVESDAGQPYSFVLDTNALPNGSHFIKVKAYDTTDQEATAEIVLNVDNRGQGSRSARSAR